MGEEIFVVQVVTDGDYGFPLDRVCEIGICKVDLEKVTVDSVYSARTFLEPGSFTKKQKAYFEETFVLMTFAVRPPVSAAVS